MSGKSASTKKSFFEDYKVNLGSKMKQSVSSTLQKAKKVDISKAQLKTHLIRKFKKINSGKISKQAKFSKVLENSKQPISDEGNFTCAICLQILISPVIFQCGHFGCLKCIETVSVYQNKCFLCRKVFENLEIKPSTVISTIINKNIVKNMDNPIEYYTRLADHLQWVKKKQLTIEQAQIGSFVDVRCSESGKWKNGVIMAVKNPQISKFVLLIKYKYEGENVEELIGITSSRLAKRGFYTEKRAIQACNEQMEETQIDIPQISIESFENVQMDRNTFFVGRKEQNYFSDAFGVGEEFGMEQKALTPESFNGQEGFDYFERDLYEFLNPQIGQGFLETELLEVYL